MDLQEVGLVGVEGDGPARSEIGEELCCISSGFSCNVVKVMVAVGF